MKQISLNINGHPVVVKVSKWTRRPKANGIYIRVPFEAEGFLGLIQECIEVMFNITIDIHTENGFYIPETEAVFLEEASVIRGLKKAEAMGWLNSSVAK